MAIASVILISAKGWLGLVVLFKPGFVSQDWQVFVIFQALNLFGVVLVGWGTALMPLASKAGSMMPLPSDFQSSSAGKSV